AGRRPVRAERRPPRGPGVAQPGGAGLGGSGPADGPERGRRAHAVGPGPEAITPPDRETTMTEAMLNGVDRNLRLNEDFACRRGAGLANLPEGERRDWQRLWQEVEAVRQHAAGPPNPANPGRP